MPEFFRARIPARTWSGSITEKTGSIHAELFLLIFMKISQQGYYLKKMPLLSVANTVCPHFSAANIYLRNSKEEASPFFLRQSSVNSGSRTAVRQQKTAACRAEAYF